jgi:hypothetical protein
MIYFELQRTLQLSPSVPQFGSIVYRFSTQIGRTPQSDEKPAKKHNNSITSMHEQPDL